MAGALTSTTTSFLLRPTLTRHARMMERPTCFERSLILNNGFQRIRDCAATSHSRLSESREDQSNGSTEEKFTSENKKNSSSKADDLMTFDDAAIRLREVEDIERAKRSGSALTDEVRNTYVLKSVLRRMKLFDVLSFPLKIIVCKFC